LLFSAAGVNLLSCATGAGVESYIIPMAASLLRSVTATTSYVSLESQRAERVSILNKTGATLDIQMTNDTGSSKAISLADGLSVVIQVGANANEIQIKSASGTSGVYVVIDS